MPGSTDRCRECRLAFHGRQNVSAVCVVCNFRSHIKCLKASLASVGREFNPFKASDPVNFKCAACDYEQSLSSLLIENTDSRRETVIAMASAYEDADEENHPLIGTASTPKSQIEPSICGISPEARGNNFVMADFSIVENNTGDDERKTILSMSEDLSKLMGVLTLINQLTKSVERLHLENADIKLKLSEVLKAQSSVDKHVCMLGACLSTESKSTTPQANAMPSTGRGGGIRKETRVETRPPGNGPASSNQVTSELEYGITSPGPTVLSKPGGEKPALQYSGVVQRRGTSNNGASHVMRSTGIQRPADKVVREKATSLLDEPLQRTVAVGVTPEASHPTCDGSKAPSGDKDGFTLVENRRRRRGRPHASPISGNSDPVLNSRATTAGPRQTQFGVRNTPALPTVGNTGRKAALFISRFNPSVTALDIESFLRGQLALSHLKCTRMKTRFGSYASFHIEVSEPDFDLINNPALWPTGSLLSKFYGRLLENQRFVQETSPPGHPSLDTGASSVPPPADDADSELKSNNNS